MTDSDIIKVLKLKTGKIYRCKTRAVTLDLWIKLDGKNILSSRDLELWKPISQITRSNLCDKFISIFQL